MLGMTEQPHRRFPPPWSVEETAPCFIVRDANKQALAFVYYEDEQGRRTTAKMLTRDEARRIAANIAKLPGLGSFLALPGDGPRVEISRLKYPISPIRFEGLFACLFARGSYWRADVSCCLT
jgi:hypothetical protein